MKPEYGTVRFVAGLGYELDIAASDPLPELIGMLEAVCAAAEDDGTASTVDSCAPSVVLLRLGPGSTGDGQWPGPVGVAEVSRWERVVRRLERLPAVSLAVASGDCRGPALELLLAADYRIAAADLRLFLPINAGQFWPGMAVHRLVHQLGVARARQIVLWCHDITVERALELQLVDEVAADVEMAVQSAAVLLGRAAGTELAVRRQLLLEAPSAGAEDALGVHLAACDRELRRLAALRVQEGTDR